MGKRIAAAPVAEVSFRERRAGLRKAAGFTQIELAAELGVSQRMMAIEKLGVADKRQVLQIVDAFIARGQLRRKAESRA